MQPHVPDAKEDGKPSQRPHSLSWVMYSPSIRFLSAISLLLLAILALLWHTIPISIDSLIKAAIERCSRILPLCRDFINYLKALVTPKPKPKPKPKPELKPKTTPESKLKPNPKTGKDPTPLTDPIPVTDPTQEQDDDDDKDNDEDQPQNQGPTPPTIPTVRKIVAVFRRHIVDPLRNLDILRKNPGPGPGPTPPTPPTPPHIPIRKTVKDIVDRLGKLDILKSIVYGGLIESITSLGVVSSAAASGASTLNVFALGVTSLFSGFILMWHSLLELKAKHLEAEKRAKDNPGQKKEETPYQTQLGNYRNVILHWVVVLTSFLVFGAIPPLCYGLFFRETDKGHYKAALVLAVSLFCVTSLSFAKVYAFQIEKKFKTVRDYTGMAVAASALSFITSHFFSEMLEKWGFRKPASD